MQKNTTTISEACKQLNDFFSDLDKMMQMVESQLTSSDKSDYNKHELYTEHPRGKFYISNFLSLLFMKNEGEHGTFQVLTRLHDESYGRDREWGEINPFTKGESEIALILTDMPQQKWAKNMPKYTGTEVLNNHPNLRTIEEVDDYYRGYLIWDDIRINFIIKVEKLSSFSEGDIDSLISEKIIDVVPNMEILLRNYQLSS